jgi:hypothetical protein
MKLRLRREASFLTAGFGFMLSWLAGFAQQQLAGQLPELQVVSTRIANQSPAGTFAMPVSALRFEPRVDLQARNLGEAQSDLTIRGGTFETVGIRIGGVSLIDPQTGHYLAEIPVAPEMLQPPEVITGAGLALSALNATSGVVSYSWRPIRCQGALNVTAGDGRLFGSSLYQGYEGTIVRADFALARSASEGLLPDSDHEFGRLTGRMQLVGARSQTDFFAGYQAKFFGLRNLYTPFNSPESENLQTVLWALNHRMKLSRESFIEVSLYHRRNKDDYAFNRNLPMGPVHPFQHTAWVSGAAVAGRLGDLESAIVFRGEMLGDEIQSTSLNFGRYRTRTLAKFAAAGEKSWSVADGSRIGAKIGATLDDSNRTGGFGSPVLELDRTWSGSVVNRMFIGFAGASQLPSYTALNSNPAAGLFRGNSGLGRERSQNLELGVAGSGFNWSGHMALFMRKDRGLVDWTFRRGVTARSANAVDVDTLGFESVVRRSWTRFDLVLGYTALLKDADYGGGPVDASFYALNYARHRLTAALVVRFSPQWTVAFDNAARIQADNFLRARGGDETLFSALGLTFRPQAWRGVSLTLRADNLWNSNYQEVPAVPAAPRLISLGMAYAW